LVKYLDESGHGLANQGWKDSADAIRWRDGRLAEAPIALVEAQAYAVEAALHTADLLDAVSTESSDHGLGLQLRAFAERMVERVRNRFWVHEDGARWLALAVDGHGGAVDAIGSNMGHVLGTGCLSPEETTDVVRLLTDPRMLTPWGVATYASDNGGFNPIGYHTGSVWTHDTAICGLGMMRAGHAAAAGKVAARLLDVAEAFDYRLPELFSGRGVLDRPVPYPASCRPQAWSAASAVALLHIALGLDVDFPRGTLTVRPAPGLPFGPVRVEGIRVGTCLVTVSVSATGEVAVDGLPAGITLVAESHSVHD
jgi:glycogen debranching enzyme